MATRIVLLVAEIKGDDVWTDADVQETLDRFRDTPEVTEALRWFGITLVRATPDNIAPFFARRPGCVEDALYGPAEPFVESEEGELP
jgi:hypothetical protein